VHGVTHSNAGSGVGGLNTADGGVGIWGEAPSGFGFYTPNNVQQARDAGGWVKAMAYVNGTNAPYNIIRCFNSTLAGAAATTPPCGFALTQLNNFTGVWTLDFGFQVSDRFISATSASPAVINACFSDGSGYCTALTPNQLLVFTFERGGSNTVWANYHVLVY